MIVTDVWFHLVVFSASVVWATLAIADKGLIKRFLWWALSFGANVSLYFGMATLIVATYDSTASQFIYDIQPFPYAKLGPAVMMVLDLAILLYVVYDELISVTSKLNKEAMRYVKR